MSKPEQLLEKLQRCQVFDAGFPQRKRLTHAEAAQLPAEERHGLDHVFGGEATRLVPNARELADIARRLGKAKFEPAVPTLAAIWRDCALYPLRNAAGHALREIGSFRARLALVELIEDADWFSAYMAIRAIFDAAPLTAYERLIGYFDTERMRQPGGAVIPANALSLFAPSSFTSEGPDWTEPRAPQTLRDDPRWIELCVKLRHDELLGDAARNVLRYVEPALFESALAAAQLAEGPRIIERQTRAFGDLLTRYRAGEHVEVWRTLRSLGPIDGDLRDEALAVGRETMQRVAHNLDLLAERFAARGWRPLYGEHRTKPSAEDAHFVAEIERITKSPIPPSLLAFWQVVGGVNLIWNYDTNEKPPPLFGGVELEFDMLDPICVDPLAATEYQFEDWEHAIGTMHPELLDPFALSLAPDYLHKANISGGGPYGIELPFFGADPIFQSEEHGLPFVDYLRHTLRWAGFSRLDRHASDKGVAEFVQSFTAGFEPF